MITTQPILLNNDDLKAITPTQVETYLELHGWQRVERYSRWGQLWRPTAKPSNLYSEIAASDRLMVYYGNKIAVVSLCRHNLSDYDKRMAELVVALGVFEGRMPGDILNDIKMIDHSEFHDAWIAAMRRNGADIEEND